jgi:hypothetical protein
MVVLMIDTKVYLIKEDYIYCVNISYIMTTFLWKKKKNTVTLVLILKINLTTQSEINIITMLK